MSVTYLKSTAPRLRCKCGSADLTKIISSSGLARPAYSCSNCGAYLPADLSPPIVPSLITEDNLEQNIKYLKTLHSDLKTAIDNLEKLVK